jgi:hypothetical protein
MPCGAEGQQEAYVLKQQASHVPACAPPQALPAQPPRRHGSGLYKRGAHSCPPSHTPHSPRFGPPPTAAKHALQESGQAHVRNMQSRHKYMQEKIEPGLSCEASTQQVLLGELNTCTNLTAGYASEVRPAVQDLPQHALFVGFASFCRRPIFTQAADMESHDNGHKCINLPQVTSIACLAQCNVYVEHSTDTHT